MTMQDGLGTLRDLPPHLEAPAKLYSLPELERKGYGPISRLPVSLRVVLESLLRNLDGRRVTEADVRSLARWEPLAERVREVPFFVSRVLLQDFTGVPLLVDLAAMRSAVARAGRDPTRVAPVVPVDLVIDHSIQVDHFREPASLELNMAAHLDNEDVKKGLARMPLAGVEELALATPGYHPERDPERKVAAELAAKALTGKAKRRTHERKPSKIRPFRWSGRQDLNLRPLGPERPQGDSHGVAGRGSQSHPADLVGSEADRGSHTEAPIPPETTPFGAPVARLGRGVEDWIDPAEVAARLKVSRATVYALVKSGQLHHRRVGLQIRVSLSALEAFLAGSP